jgi:tyrosyl-tRNA synthetase
MKRSNLREYAADKKKKFKPVIISHHMLMGLKEGQEKMSKSDPESAIFMEDTAADVKRKIKKAYCPPQVVEKNPIMDYAKHIIFGYYGKMTISIEGVRFIDSISFKFLLLLTNILLLYAGCC